MCLELVKPCIAYKDSYIAVVEEFRAAGEALIPWVMDLPYQDFQQLLQLLEENERGVNLKAGFAPHTCYWLLDAKRQKVVGVSNLRHRLTPYLEKRGGHIGYGVAPSERQKGYATAILAKTLEQAVDLGLKKALITCNKQNEASRKTIIKNGGVFFNEEFLETENAVIQRFWIEL